jgi:hypothetical protein
MTPPFTRAEFFEVFARYNEAVWPAQVVLYLPALAAVTLLVSPRAYSGRAIAGVLALLWLWMGAVYHLVYFRSINPAAVAFGLVSMLGGAAFAWEGVVRNRLRFATGHGARTYAGCALLAYALLAYPLLAIGLGHAYPAMPTFGLPCPTTIFTLGMLALLRAPYPRHVFIVPILWTLVGSQAAILFGVLEDLGLAVAGLAGLWVAFRGGRSHARPLVS